MEWGKQNPNMELEVTSPAYESGPAHIDWNASHRSQPNHLSSEASKLRTTDDKSAFII